MAEAARNEPIHREDGQETRRQEQDEAKKKEKEAKKGKINGVAALLWPTT